jgi:3-phenylpropionate/trans-cinnamate dioxygenase ferredoxin reductase subunit
VATGSRPRSLPFLDGYSNVQALRTLNDARWLRRQLRPGARLAVVGAGFIGQEVAATARKLGAEVTIVEALDLPLAPILGRRMGHWFAQLHRDNGVELLLSARIKRARGDGRVEELVLAGGRRLPCDAVVVGVGVAPAAEWLAGSGLDPDGVRIDAAGRTAVPDVFAAGDVTLPFDPRLGAHARTEHWDAAARQGATAAQAMLGAAPGTPPAPSFWSDQYGVRIQYLGYASHADEEVVEGDPASRDFAVVYKRRGLPVGALAVGRPRALARMRRQIDISDPLATNETEMEAA